MGWLIGVYFLVAIWLILYGLNCHVMTRLFRRHVRDRRLQDRALLRRFYHGGAPLSALKNEALNLPKVTTQLPVYNERNVAERLIDAVAAFHYPAGKHEIQVLDDSTDDTRAIVAARVAALRRQGVNIRHLTRDHRTGFKAGALREGLAQAQGDFTAIFDADFVPPADFLLRAMPFFVMDQRLGFVQGRWWHLNRETSLITRLQSIGINGHFMIEQSARNCAELFMNFNGTAGIFRNQAVFEAGNWQDDTLTEDMDLSYRIQLAGWRCRYLVDLEVPAEIPVNINAFKNQQFRWAKGSIQTALKLLPRILRSPARPFAKLQAVMHLTHYMTHPLMLFLAIMAVPILIGGTMTWPTLLFWLFGLILALGCSGPSVMYLTAETELNASFWKTVGLLPVMICFGCGLAVNNTRAVLEALLGWQSEFVRTPKLGFKALKSYSPGSTRWYLLELLVGLWCLLGTFAYFSSHHYLVGHFLLMYSIGFCSIGILSWAHCRQN